MKTEGEWEMKKKWLIALLSLTACMAVSACGGDKQSDSAIGSSEYSASSSAESVMDSASNSEIESDSNSTEVEPGEADGPILQMFQITFAEEDGTVV